MFRILRINKRDVGCVKSESGLNQPISHDNISSNYFNVQDNMKKRFRYLHSDRITVQNMYLLYMNYKCFNLIHFNPELFKH